MNCFLLFDLPARFDLDQEALEKKYFELQRALHPDRLAADERAAAIQKSADVNEGYRTLKSPLKRAQHLLALEGIRVNTDHDTVRPDEALLTEIMELREAMAAGNKPDIAARKQATLDALGAAFEAEEYERAAHLTLRLNYLNKMLRDAGVSQ